MPTPSPHLPFTNGRTEPRRPPDHGQTVGRAGNGWPPGVKARAARHAGQRLGRAGAGGPSGRGSPVRAEGEAPTAGREAAVPAARVCRPAGTRPTARPERPAAGCPEMQDALAPHAAPQQGPGDKAENPTGGRSLGGEAPAETAKTLRDMQQNSSQRCTS